MQPSHSTLPGDTAARRALLCHKYENIPKAEKPTTGQITSLIRIAPAWECDKSGFLPKTEGLAPALAEL